MIALTRWASMAAICAMAQWACAAEAPPDAGTDTATDTATPPSTTDEVIESTRDSVRSTVEWLASGIDQRFGDKPFSDGGKVSDGQIGVSFLNREGHSSHANIRFNARLRLPNLSKIPYLFLGNDDARDVVTDQPDHRPLKDVVRERNTTDNSFFAGLGLLMAKSIDVRLGFRGGLKPYAQARLRHGWQITDYDWLEARETLFYTIQDRAGSTTALEFRHAFAPDLALRWLNATTITQHVPHAAWNSSLGLFKSFGQEKVFGVELQHSGSEDNNKVTTNDIGLVTSWEQPLHKNVLGQIQLGHFWSKTSLMSERDGQWAFGATVLLKF